ncbi:MAG: hypothetical protein ABI142_12585 [Bryocella sp.]
MNRPFQPATVQPHTGARASVVNRTHRIIREQALVMQANRRRRRSLWIPIGIFSVLISIIFVALWSIAAAYDATSGGVPDAGDQLMVWTMWIAPLTIVMLGLVWLQRQRQRRKEDHSR